jgi:hypothetical protein
MIFSMNWTWFNREISLQLEKKPGMNKEKLNFDNVSTYFILVNASFPRQSDGDPLPASRDLAPGRSSHFSLAVGGSDGNC